MVEFRVLGAVNLLGSDGREVRSVLAQPKRIALLAYLAAATPRGFRRRDSLLALFWPELDQEHARAALRQALHGLRRALGEGAIESRGDGELRLASEHLWCDVSAFSEALDESRPAAALDLYRGDLMGGFFISGAPEFERWLEEERATLRRRAVDAAWRLAGSCKTAGDATLAAHWARRASSLVRDDDEALRRLIALLGDLGDRAGALQAYEAFARRLADEYEAEPSAETRSLVASIRSRENEVPAQLTASRPERSADVELASTPAPAATAPPYPARMAARPDASLRSRGQRSLAPLGAMAALAIITFGAALVWGSDTASLDPSRVVVAGVWNRSGDSTLDALGDLARDEITRGLALTEVVEVADPVPSAPVRASERRPVARGEEAAAARALAVATGSGLAVWGTVQRRGGEIELAANIVDERSRRILRTLEPVRGDPLEPGAALTLLRDRIMVVVAEARDPRLSASASAAAGPPRYDAYTAFITGVGIWYDGRNGRDALPHFRRASTLDSTFALPLIWAAWVHQTFGQCDSTAAIADRLATLALSRLEQLQIERQMARCNGDLAGAYRLAHALVDARPVSEVWQEQLARDALNFQRPREAATILERLHPDRGALRGRPSYYNWLTNAHHLLGQHDVELDVARRGRARFPGNLASWRTELVALAALGRGREVNRRLDEVDALAADPLRRKSTVMREIALDLAAHGDTRAASAALKRTLAWHAAQPANERARELTRFERALTYYAAGHADSAHAVAEALHRAHPLHEDYVGLLGALAARSGDRQAAAGNAARLAAHSARRGRGRATYWRACIAAQLGQRTEAVTLLRQSLAEGYVFNGLFFLSAHVEPSFAPLRGYEPFEELLRPKG